MEDNNISSHSTSDKRDKKRKHKKMKDSADEEQLDQAIISLAAAANSQRSDDQRARTHVDNNQQRKKQSRTSAWNFEVDYNDHFETPLRAYEDLQPVLQAICNKTSKTSEQLIVYDPYYCQGKMLEHMKSLGYSNVINRNRDFYRDITTKQIPAFDILVTNPPYSGEHKVRLLNYLRTADKPFALLLPAYIATKSYWKAFLDDGPRQALYILPPDYYHYLHPEGTGKALPPFYSAWLIGGLDAAEQQR